MRFLRTAVPLLLPVAVLLSAARGTAAEGGGGGSPAALVALSLKALQQRAAAMDRARYPEEVRQLAGITRLDGFVVDRGAGDVIVFGPADPEGRPLHLDDFVVALRNAWLGFAEVRGDVRIYSHPGCSIDPEESVIGELREVGSAIDPGDAPEEVERRLERWHSICGKPQRVRVEGVPFHSGFASVMVTADYDMKRLANGSDSLDVAGFRSVTDLNLDRARDAVAAGEAIALSGATMTRFWFHPGEQEYAADGTGGVVDRCGVTLLTEEEHIARSGKPVGTGRTDPAAAAFCRAFRDHYDEIALRRPIYRDLAGLFRLVAVAKLMRAHLGEEAGTVLLDFLVRRHEIAEVRVESRLPGRSHVKAFHHREDTGDGFSEIHLWLPTCGGVSMSIRPGTLGPPEPVEARSYRKTGTEWEEGELDEDGRARIERIRAAVLSARPTGDAMHWTFRLGDDAKVGAGDE